MPKVPVNYERQRKEIHERLSIPDWKILEEAKDVDTSYETTARCLISLRKAFESLCSAMWKPYEPPDRVPEDGLTVGRYPEDRAL
jgi:hypothetical protein